MNQALSLKNWNDGGNNYILKGNEKNKWVGFQSTVLDKLSNKFRDDFNIIIWTNKQKEKDYYCIPFAVLKHLFIDEHKTTGNHTDRWTSIILHDQFLMHSNSQLSVDIKAYYALELFPKTIVELDDDFFIEDAKAEINRRIGQSKFRKGVLKNFNNKCALTGLSDKALLTASHIIPWAQKKDYRGDISNGICLYIEYDAFFDKGLISFTDDLEIIVTSESSTFSQQLMDKLNELKRDYPFLTAPVNKSINKKYLDYHRKYVFEWWLSNKQVEKLV